MAAISSDTALSLGETAVLTCIGYAIPLVQVAWMHNGHNITNTSTVTITEADIVLSNALFRQSSLKICSVRPTDAGTYTCTVTNIRTDIEASTVVSAAGKLSSALNACV